MVLADSFYYQPVQIDTINTRVNADLFAKEGDANGRGMVVQITENGIIKDTTGITLRLQWSHLSVGVSGFTDFEVVDATKGLYKLIYPTSMLHRGRVEAFIRITDNGILSGTRNLLITVERMVGSDETIEASDDFSALQSALTKLSIWEATYGQEFVSLQQQLAEKADLSQLSQVASPLVASLSAQMTDTTRIYVYTGAEGGYVAGNWYYHNGTAFVSGGVYQSSGIGDDSIIPIYLKSQVRDAIGSFALDPKDLQFGFYNGGSTFYENSGYFAIKNPCQPFDIYKLGFVSAFQNCVNFFDADFVYKSSLAIPTFESTQYIDLEIVMPDGCYWYTISSKILEGANNEDNIFAKKYTLNANRNPFKLFADFDGTDLYIKNKYDATRDLCINIRKRGGNLLPDFEKIFLTANTEKFVDTNLFPSTVLLANSTDWFAPYKVRAINTIDGDLPENWYIDFTGGNHQYNNSGSGSTATARCADFKVLFDGVAATDASEFCNIVEVIWTNYIQGQNTKKADGTGREILKETIRLRFDGDICSYENVLEPLEDIRLYQYYGLQHYNNNANSVRFVGGSNRAVVASSASANSGNDKCNAIQAFTNNLLVEFGIDKNTDLGQLDKLVLQAHSAFTSNDKAYFNIIDVDADGADAVVTDGALYALKGYYKFSKPI